MRNYRIWTSKKEYIEVDAECPSMAVALVGRRWIWKIERGDEMAVTDEIKAKAGDLELLPNWRSMVSRLTPLGYAYGKDNEPRRYYTNGEGRYYYRGVTESEMHRNK